MSVDSCGESVVNPRCTCTTVAVVVLYMSACLAIATPNCYTTILTDISYVYNIQYASWRSFRSVLLPFPFRLLMYTFTSALFYRFVTVLPCTVIRFLLPVLQRRIPIGVQQQSSRAVRLVVFVVSSLGLSKSYLRVSVASSAVASTAR